MKKSYPNATILAVDNASGMLEKFKEKVKKHEWKNVSTKHLDGGDMTGIFIHSNLF